MEFHQRYWGFVGDVFFQCHGLRSGQATRLGVGRYGVRPILTGHAIKTQNPTHELEHDQHPKGMDALQWHA